MNIINLEETASTNTWLRQHPESAPGTVVNTFCQSVGRGQRGNSWESEPGKNLTFSILVCPHAIPPARQMAISRATSLAIVRWLDRYLPDNVTASIKWPNDIYVGDKKICGILIEHVISSGRIERTVIGVGININQKRFLSDAPNPVSLSSITGSEYHLPTMLEEVAKEIFALVEAENDARGELTETAYFARLWRQKGNYTFIDKNGEFEARIASVAPDGTLTLQRADGTLSSYAFKEVSFKL